MLIFSYLIFVRLFLAGLLRKSLADRCSAIFLSTFYETYYCLEGLCSFIAGYVWPEADLGVIFVGKDLGADLA